jgi:hypothetical protein
MGEEVKTYPGGTHTREHMPVFVLRVRRGASGLVPTVVQWYRSRTKVTPVVSLSPEKKKKERKKKKKKKRIK